MRTLVRVAAVLALLVTAVACAPAPAPSLSRVSHPAQLANTSWDLVTLNGASPVPGTAATLEFTATQFGGAAPCNSFGGAFAYDAGTGAVRFDQIVSTKRACVAGPASQLEAAYFAALRTVSEADMDVDGHLVLVSAGGPLVFGVAGRPALPPPSVRDPGPS